MAINPKLEQDAYDFCDMALVLQAAHHRVSYEAAQVYGDHGPLISGVVRDHFPEAVKDILRKLAHTSSEFKDRSLNCWMQSGRRQSTWREKVHGRETRNARQR